LKSDKVAIKQTLARKVAYRIKRSVIPVFVPHDFADLAEYDQVGRILRRFVKEGLLIKLGQGIYTRSKISKFTGKSTLEKPLRDLAIDALTKLGIEVVSTSFEKAYNQGKTTQVPTGRVIGVKKRVSRKISYQGKSIIFDKVVCC